MRIVHGPTSISRHSTYPHVKFSRAAIHLTVPKWELPADRASLSQSQHLLESLLSFPCMGSPPQTSPYHDRRNDAQARKNMLRVSPRKTCQTDRNECCQEDFSLISSEVLLMSWLVGKILFRSWLRSQYHHCRS